MLAGCGLFQQIVNENIKWDRGEGITLANCNAEGDWEIGRIAVPEPHLGRCVREQAGNDTAHAASDTFLEQFIMFKNQVVP